MIRASKLTVSMVIKLEAAFYKDALSRFSTNDFKNAGYPAAVPQRLAEIGSQEATHVTALSGILTGLGIAPTQPCVRGALILRSSISELTLLPPATLSADLQLQLQDDR